MLRENYRENPKNDFMFDLDLTNTVSKYEFTGMMPTPPKNENEEENYKEILNFTPETVDAFNSSPLRHSEHGEESYW